MDDGLADLLHRIVASFGDLARQRIAAGPAQLTYTQLRIIGTLEEMPGVTQQQLADSLGLSAAAMSRALAVLRQADFVEIMIDPTHARRRLVSATAAGLKEFHSSGTVMANDLKSWLVTAGFPYERYLEDSRQLAELLSPRRKNPTDPGIPAVRT